MNWKFSKIKDATLISWRDLRKILLQNTLPKKTFIWNECCIITRKQKSWSFCKTTDTPKELRLRGKSINFFVLDEFPYLPTI